MFPRALDVAETFGRLGGEVSGVLGGSPWPRVSLALRAGGERLIGDFPWHQSAFLGGVESPCGWDEQRFAGDGSVFGSAGLRLRLWRPRVVVPVGVGAFGFADAGRVFVDGESPGDWHSAFGGGLFFQPVAQPYLMRVGVGNTSERTEVFVLLGLPY